MPILETYERSLEHFVPRSHRQFVLLQIAQRFQDTGRLATYLTLPGDIPKKALLEAARLATRAYPDSLQEAAAEFFESLKRWRDRGEI